MDDFNFDLVDTQPQALIQQPVEDVIVVIGTPLTTDAVYGDYINNTWMGDINVQVGNNIRDAIGTDPSPGDGIPGLTVEVTQNDDGTYTIIVVADFDGWFDTIENGIWDEGQETYLVSDESLVIIANDASERDAYLSGLETFVPGP